MRWDFSSTTKGRKAAKNLGIYASRELIHVSCCLLADGKWGPLNEDVFPMENGDFPASYVSLREANSPFCFCLAHFPNLQIYFWTRYA